MLRKARKLVNYRGKKAFKKEIGGQKNAMKEEQGMMALPSISAMRCKRQRNLCEFETSLVYII